MRKITADYIFPVSSTPIKNGVVIIDDEKKIVAIESSSENFETSTLEKYEGIICPGFVNAHCHLELSYMKGKLPIHKGLVNFIFNVLRSRNDKEDGVEAAMLAAENQMLDGGIVAVGDISNASTSFQLKSKSLLRYHTFVECFGLVAEPKKYLDQSIKVLTEALELKLNASVSPHAPYSMSNELFELIFSFEGNSKEIFSYHNQESEEENKLYRGGKSAFDNFYDEFKLPSTNYRKAESSLKANLMFFPSNKKILLVHNTFSTDDDFITAIAHNPQTFFCTCPNANIYIENKLPDYSFWKNYSDRVCIGTDSLASNHKLSILEEMKTIQLNDASVSTEQLIKWATLNAATFFGWENELGSIEVNKKPGLNLISSVGDQMQLLAGTQVKKIA